jgi:hypothetical protein
MKRDSWFHLIAFVGGAAAWIAVAQASGRREAWDSPLYFTVAVPVVCLLSALLGFLEPRRSWRWGVTPLAGQFAWMLASEGPGNLLPLGVIVFAVWSLPSVLTARLGAFVAGFVRRSADPAQGA